MPRKTAEELWTIADLAARVTAALGGDFNGVPSGRVRDVPDLRSIRYYTMLGLLARPEIRGRTAYYGRRHLLELVAIKRLQAQGLSLAQVQERLLGIGDREVEKLAAVKADVRDAAPTVAGAPREQRSARAAAFWQSAPAVAPPPPANEREHLSARSGLVTLLPLAAGISLGLEAIRTITAEDVAALQAAAEPLRKLLIERRLVRPIAKENP